MRRTILLAVSCGPAFAQEAPPKLSFEAVSIRPGPPGSMMELMESGQLDFRIDYSRFEVGSVSLQALIQYAFHLPADQITGPDWMNSARFGIRAKLPEGGSKDQAPGMLQTLLAERFHLSFHHDRKIRPVYVLTVAPGGPKFQESTSGTPGPGGCNGGFHKDCRKVTMEGLAYLLSIPSQAGRAMTGMAGGLDRPVVDMTGLKGAYDFSLEYGRMGGGRGADPVPGADVIISALDAMKPLGLRLEPAKHAFEMLVIDQIDRVPSGN